MMKSKNKKYTMIYAIICILIFSIIYFPIILTGKIYMFLDIGADTYSSYWPSISYAANLLNDIKIWDTSLGLGSSSIIQISYFLLDPFNWVVFLFEPYFMDVGLFISLCFKYIALSTMVYLYFSKMGFISWARIGASIAVVFSGWFVGWGQHYNYATMFIFFIALLYFLECWIQDGKCMCYIFTLAWLAMMTPYYTYMTLLFFALYYLMQMRHTFSFEKIGDFIKHGFKTAGICLAGIALAGVVFLPLAGDMFASPRVTGKRYPSLSLATANEYLSMLLRALSNNILGINKEFYGRSNWYEAPFMYVGCILFFLIPIFFHKNIRKRKYLLPAVFFCFACLFPYFFGVILNAFSTMSYRWTYLFVPILGIVVGKVIAELQTDNEEWTYRHSAKYTYVVINSILVLYGCWILSGETGKTDPIIIGAILSVFLFATLYFIVFERRWENKSKFLAALVIVFVFELSVNGFVSVHYRSLIPQEYKKTMAYFDESGECIDYLNNLDEGFYRINKKYAYSDLNDSMIQHYNGEKLYSSILTESYWNLQDMFDLRAQNSNYFYGFDDKQVLRDINVGKYMLTDEKKEYYGYRFLKTIGTKHIYENVNVIGFGFLYEDYITKEDFNQLNQYEMQNILYESCVLELDEEANITGLKKKDELHDFSLKPIGYEVSTVPDGIEIVLDEMNKGPLVVRIEGIENTSVQTKLYGMRDGQEVNINSGIVASITGSEVKYYNVNDLHVNKIYIAAAMENFASIEVYEKDTDMQEQQIAEKKKNVMNDIKWSDEYITGTVDAKSHSLLYLPIIYDENWQITVNGKEENVYRANGGFMTVKVAPGENAVVIEYKNKNLFYGAVLSAFTLFTLVSITGYSTIKKRKKKNDGSCKEIL